MAHQYSRVGFNSAVEVNEVNLNLSYGGVILTEPCILQHLSDQGGGFLGTQDLFFAHFTTFASAFFTAIFYNCLTIGYASFDAKKFKLTPSFSR